MIQAGAIAVDFGVRRLSFIPPIRHHVDSVQVL